LVGNNAEAHHAVVVFGRPEDPHARPVHLHNYVGTFCWGKKQRVDALRRRHRIAVKRDNRQAVTRHGERDVLGRAGIEEPKQYDLGSPAFVVFALIMLGTAVMLLFDRQFPNDESSSLNRPTTLSLAAFALFTLLALGNAVSTVLECAGSARTID
jgi:hypothetical protein